MSKWPGVPTSFGVDPVDLSAILSRNSRSSGVLMSGSDASPSADGNPVQGGPSGQVVACEICGHKYDQAASVRCPQCEAKRLRAGGAEYATSAPLEAATPTSSGGGDVPRRQAPSQAGSWSRPTGGYGASAGSALRGNAQAVQRLSSWVVTFAYVIGTVSVIAGAYMALLGLAAGAGTVSFALVGGGVVIAVTGLVQAVLLALLGRYTAMRASEVLQG